MKFGICCPDTFIPAAAAAGYDYVELGVSTALQPQREEDGHLAAIIKQLEENRLLSEALNLMLPGGFHCVGPDIDEIRLAAYFDCAVDRASKVGAKVLVFGSGTQRTIPEGFPYSTGRQQYLQALHLVGNAAAKYDILIAIEPLNHTESNLINSVAEGFALVSDVNHPSVRVLSDLYHVETDHQPFSETTEAGAALAHVHVAGAGRRAPIEPDLPVLTAFFKAVKSAGYDQRISIEANWNDMGHEAAEALRVVQLAWSAA